MSLTIGFIGLGSMGRVVALRLLGAGHALRVLDANEAALERLLNEGPDAQPASSLAEIAAACDVVCTCLPSLAAIREVHCGGPDALSRTASPGTLVLELSTTDPRLTVDLHDRFAARGVAYVEAPLFGGPAQAEAGDLYIALSGPEAVRTGGDSRRLTEVLTPIARLWRWVGGPGAASAVKVFQNGLGLAQLVAMAEIRAACEAWHLDPLEFQAIVLEAGGMAASPLFRDRFPRMIEAAPAIEARLAIAAKDAELCSLLFASDIPEASAIAASARALALAVEAGLADEDVVAVWRAFAQPPAMEPAPLP